MSQVVTKLTAKDRARRIVDRLPDDATWEDLEYSVSVCRRIAEGLKDIEEGRVVSHAEVRREFGLDPS